MFSNLISVLLTNKISEEVFVRKFYSMKRNRRCLVNVRMNKADEIVLGIVFARPQMQKKEKETI